MIKEFHHVVSTDRGQFDKKVKEAIDEYQEEGYTVDIQYSLAISMTLGNGVPVYSAFITGRSK